ncbi:MAG: hypothetical protein KAJ01_05105, partial [Candidatus Hydrogenedentes bacterium]|nr:hypothetical protein [Candidatus Hydrogenedentota bacterium]
MELNEDLGEEIMYNRRKKRALRLALMTADEFVGNRSEATLDTRSHPVWDSGIVSRCKDMIEQMLNRHFKGQQDTFPYGRIERLLNALVQSESGQGQGHGISGKAVARFLHKLDPVLVGWTESGSAAVDALLTRALHTAAVDAFRAAFATWDERLGVDLRPTPEMMVGPSSWAERRAAELAALIQETTRNRIAGIIAKGLERGLSGRAIIGNIRHYLDG